jgi:hypothetical protein
MDKTPVKIRRGSAYLAILGASMLVATIGLSAIMVARVQMRAGSLAGDIEQARDYAHSGIEMGRVWISADPNWRTNYRNGDWTDKQPIGSSGGAFTLTAIDPNDGDISNWPTDPLVLRARGFKGTAEQIEQVTLVPDQTPLGCLSSAVFSGGDFSVAGGKVISDRFIGTNGNFAASSALVDADVEARGSISGSQYLGSRVSGVNTRAMPPSTVFDHYIANGTSISFASTGGKIENTLLSPSHNPFGSQTNPQGIYVINCAGNKIELRNCRIVGTLVILNPKSDSTLRDSVSIEPVVSGFPVLLVRGTIRFEQKSEPLVESSGRNFNPPGAAYAGEADNDVADSYPSLIRGLCYFSGDVTQKDQAVIDGVVIVGGRLTVDGTLNCRYDARYETDPPTGFSNLAKMKVVPGSWKRIVN